MVVVSNFVPILRIYATLPILVLSGFDYLKHNSYGFNDDRVYLEDFSSVDIVLQRK